MAQYGILPYFFPILLQKFQKKKSKFIVLWVKHPFITKLENLVAVIYILEQ